MPLRPYIDDPESIEDQNIRSLYRPYAGENKSLVGKHVLDVESRDGWALEDVASLKSALSRELERKREAKEKLAKLVDQDGKELDIDEVLSAHREYLKLKENGLGGKEKVDQLLESERRSLNEKYSKQIQAANEKAARIERQWKDSVLKAEAVAAIERANGFVKALLPHVQGSAQVRVDEDGRTAVVVLDENGNPKLSAQPGNQGYMTLLEYVEELKKDPELRGNFKGASASGGSLNGDGRVPSATHNRVATGNLFGVELLKHARRQ